MARKKLIIVISGICMVILVGVGGTFGALKFLSHKKTSTTSVTVVPPRPLYFTDVLDVTVSIPPDPNTPPTSFVQVGLQFSTYDPAVIVSYVQLQPIIKAEIISILMTQTSSGLSDIHARATLIKACLDISNSVLLKNANFKSSQPFGAAYITNLVVQE
ncbi:MAG: hypothetical protein B7Z81_10475 [Acidocella sp. 20-61-6]|nr:MAG: hypothetical protein B7Z81_10475 [Acidocella sp. 20-61-6]